MLVSFWFNHAEIAESFTVSLTTLDIILILGSLTMFSPALERGSTEDTVSTDCLNRLNIALQIDKFGKGHSCLSAGWRFLNGLSENDLLPVEGLPGLRAVLDCSANTRSSFEGWSNKDPDLPAVVKKVLEPCLSPWIVNSESLCDFVM